MYVLLLCNSDHSLTFASRDADDVQHKRFMDLVCWVSWIARRIRK
jgi:hypothetical protein